MHDAQNSGKTDIVIQDNLSLAWTYNPPQAAPGWQWNQPSLDDSGNIYYAAGYYFVSLNNEGTLRWSKHTAHVFMGPPAVHNGYVYFPCSEGSLYAYTLAGNYYWSYDMVHPVNGGPTVGPDGVIYIGDAIEQYLYDSYLTAINPDGTEKWKTTFLNSDGFYTAPPLDPDGSILYAAPGNFKLYGVNTIDGDTLWSYQYNSIMNLVYSSPVVADFSGSKFIMFGDLGNMSGGHWRVVDENGNPRWTTSITNSVQQTAAVDPDGYFYFACNGSVLKKIDTTGNEIWSRTFSQGYLSNPIIEGNGSVLIGTETGYLHILDQNTGNSLSSIYLGTEVGSPIVGDSGEVYVLYGNGTLVCLKNNTAVVEENLNINNILKITNSGKVFRISIGNNIGQCNIYNINGSKVFSEIINTEIIWDANNYTAGTYFVRVKTQISGNTIEDNVKIQIFR